MARYVIVGLESSVTKALSRIVARNLEIRGHKKYDGHHAISDDKNLVSHVSFPYGKGRGYPTIESEKWDFILLCTRDFFCSLKSKTRTHTKGNRKAARAQHDKGAILLQDIAKYPNTYFFSYETWFILKDPYMERFLRQINVDYIHPSIPLNVNRKHIKM